MKKLTETLANALPIIAAGLGDKLGIKVVVRGTGASTNGTVITIPDFKIDSQAEKDAVLGYVSHEAGHIKFESFKDLDLIYVFDLPLRKTMWNIFEDVRIENRMIEAYIGSKSWMNQVWINWIAKGKLEFRTPEDEPIQIIESFLLHYGRVNYRNQEMLSPYSNAAILAFESVFGGKLLREVKSCVDEKLPLLCSSKSSLELADEVLKIIQTHKPDDPEDDSNDDSDESDTSNESEDQSENQSSSGDSDNLDPNAEDVKQAIQDVLNAEFDDISDEMKDKFTSEMESKAEDNPVSSRVGIPDFQYPKDGENGGILMQSVKSCSNLISAKLTGLIQQDVCVRSRTNTRGNRLNSKVLYRASVGDARLFKTKAQKKSIDTIVEIMLDSSSSMSASKHEKIAPIDIAKEAQGALAVALDKINGVSVTASAFPCSTKVDCVNELLSEGESVKKLFPRLDSVFPCGSTPSCSAMWHSLRKVMNSRKKRKVIMFITDGAPDSTHRWPLHELIQLAERSNIIIVGIAIGPIAYNKPQFEHYFKHAAFITNISELKNEMFKIAQKVILD